jgi:putative phosphoribosyl transferase
MDQTSNATSQGRQIQVKAGAVVLEGDLALVEGTSGVVLFAHGSGSSRHSPRNRFVADALRDAGLATLLIDLLTADEEVIDERTAQLRFDIGLLTRRLVGATDWLIRNAETANFPIGYWVEPERIGTTRRERERVGHCTQGDASL